MKLNYKKLFIPLFFLFVIGMFAYSFVFFPTGYVGTTRKGQVNLGCVCHGDTATSQVSVFFKGPDSVAAGQTVTYTIYASHGPAIVGGFNVANFRDGGSDTLSLSGVPGDTMVRKQDGELTHTHPKAYFNDTVSWSFRYTASNVLGYDTLYATSNSTNNSGTSEGDNWNWSPNKPVRIYTPIGITNISTTASEFSISQNYPNPFNPSTQIDFSVAKAGNIQVKVFDMLGNLVSTVVDQKLTPGQYRTNFDGSGFASGTYFYSLYADGKLLSTKRMMLIK
jgi:hypothetical protein